MTEAFVLGPMSAIYPMQLPPMWCKKHLSPAEQRVVELIGTGLQTKVVAVRLGKSTLTVRNQLNNAMRKLGVSSRYKLIALLSRASVPATSDSALGARRCTTEAEAFAYAI